MGQLESPWEQLCGQVILGTELFVEQVWEPLDGKEAIHEIPRQQRHAGRPELTALFPAAFGCPGRSATGSSGSPTAGTAIR